MCRLTCVALAAFFAFTSPEAFAQQSTAEQVEALYAEGVSLYKQQKYQAAVEKFEQAYKLFPEPNLLFNIGKAKEAAGDLDGAIKAYEQCADATEVSESTRTKARSKASMLSTAKLRGATAPSETRATSGATAPSVATAPKKETSILPWVGAGVGVAAVVAGGVVYALGASDHSELNDAKTAGAGGVASITFTQAQQLADDGEQKKTIGVGLMVGGGVLAAGSVVWALLSGGDEGSVQASVMPTAEGGMAVIGGRF